MANDLNLTDYDKIIIALFRQKYKSGKGKSEIGFTKDELVETAKKLGMELRNPPDVVYTFRTRRALPKEIGRTGS